MPKTLTVAACAAALYVALAIPLVASGATVVSGHLSAGQIVNPNGGDPGATGDVTLRVNRVKQRICFRITYRNLDEVNERRSDAGSPEERR